jgi:glycine/D-amino acid oxidase-like deaminating enzyme
VSTVVIVGAGIVGSSLAYHLARQGVSVTLIDQARSPAAGVTGNSFAWIGDGGDDWPGGAEDLRGSVLMDHRRLEIELPDVTIRWTGSIAWTEDSAPAGRGDRLERGQHWISRSEIGALEPNLVAPPERAVFAPNEGGVDPVLMTEALVNAARALGAQVVLGSAATSLKMVGGRVEGVTASAQFYPASTVVLAAGTNVPTLCEPLGVKLPVAASPALLMRVAAPPGLVKTIIDGPWFNVREVRNGDLLMTAPEAGGLSEAGLQQLAQSTVDRLRAAFGNDDAIRLLGHHLGMRPMPANGPIVGYATPD